MMWKRACQRIESQIGGSQSTEAWNIVKSLKTNNTSKKSLLKMETLERERVREREKGIGAIPII